MLTPAELNEYWKRAAEEGRTHLDRRMAKKRSSVWGDDPELPSPSCFCALAFLRTVDARSLLEIGSGEGRDAMRFAQEGYAVTALEWSAAGVASGRALAEKHGVSLEFIQADYCDPTSVTGQFDVVVAFKFVHQIRRAEAPALFRRLATNTHPGGVLILTTFASGHDDNWGDKNKGREIEDDVWEVRPNRPIVFWKAELLAEALVAAGFDPRRPLLLSYEEDNHTEEGQMAGGRHKHALWFVATTRTGRE